MAKPVFAFLTDPRKRADIVDPEMNYGKACICFP